MGPAFDFTRQRTFTDRGVAVIVSRISLTVIILGVTASSFVRAADGTILPPNVDLSGLGARQRVVVEKFDGGRSVGEIRDAELTSENPTVASVENGYLVAKANGKTRLMAK